MQWAGCEGEVCYPHFLNPAVPWPPEVSANALIRQQHDRDLLTASLHQHLGPDRTMRVPPWAVHPSMSLAAALATAEQG